MIVIKPYIEFNEDKNVVDIINYIDFSINESLDVKSIWNNVVNKIKNLSDKSKRKILTHVVMSLLVFNTAKTVVNTISSSNVDPEVKQIALSIVDSTKDVDSDKDVSDKWKSGHEFFLSQKGWDHIKEEEKLKLNGYSIGDGMISIGWGHAEPAEDSDYKVGQKISKDEASNLLKSDLKEISDGVRRIFKDWERENIDVKITQDMFNALVSIAYNTGVGGLRKSELMKDLKKGNYDLTGEKIKTFKVSKKFSGLSSRREKESKMFLASL